MAQGHYQLAGGAKFALIAPGAELDRVWPAVSGYLDAALKESLQHEWTGEEVHARLASGQYLLAVARHDSAIMGAMVFDRGLDARGRKYVAMVCCGGFDMHEWLPGLVALCKKLCELQGADRIIVMGRRGWERILYRYGLRVHAVVACAYVEDITTPVDFAEIA